MTKNKFKPYIVLSASLNDHNSYMSVVSRHATEKLALSEAKANASKVGSTQRFLVAQIKYIAKPITQEVEVQPVVEKV